MNKKSVPWAIAGVLAILGLGALIYDWLDKHPWGWRLVFAVVIVVLAFLIYWLVSIP